MTYLFANVVKSIVNHLVNKDYEQLEKLISETRLSSDDIKRVVNEYGRTLIIPPEEAYQNLDVVKIQGKLLPCWSVRVSLWTKEEGCSDLTLELTIVENTVGYLVELDDIHVL